MSGSTFLGKEEAPVAEIDGRRLVLSGSSDPRVDELVDFWRGAAGDLLPLKSSFMAENFRGTMGHMSLISVEPDEIRYHFRIFSEKLQWYMKLDRKIASIEDAEPSEYRALVRAQLDEVVEERRPVLHEVRYATERDRVLYKRLSLPFGNERGAVTHILCLPVDRVTEPLHGDLAVETRPYGIG